MYKNLVAERRDVLVQGEHLRVEPLHGAPQMVILRLLGLQLISPTPEHTLRRPLVALVLVPAHKQAPISRRTSHQRKNILIEQTTLML